MPEARLEYGPRVLSFPVYGATIVIGQRQVRSIEHRRQSQYIVGVFQATVFHLGNSASFRVVSSSINFHGLGFAIIVKRRLNVNWPCLGARCPIGLIHDSRHVGFQIVMQIGHVLC